jgi:homogentisate phytyltransferase/homogentisate geranylgeranyltransferase
LSQVNKPYLPLASGEFNASTALFIIAFSVLISVLLGKFFSVTYRNYFYRIYEGVFSDSAPLICTLVSSLAFGLMYSVDIRKLHWKEHPFLATGCILIVRALIVQLGFYCHALGRYSLLFIISFVIFFV